jgi:hypothetical protein
VNVCRPHSLMLLTPKGNRAMPGVRQCAQGGAFVHVGVCTGVLYNG